MLRERDFLAKAADVNKLHAGGLASDGVLELEKKRFFVPGEGPAAVTRMSVRVNRELVGNDDGALPGRGGGRRAAAGFVVLGRRGRWGVEVRDDAGGGDHARNPAGEPPQGRSIP